MSVERIERADVASRAVALLGLDRDTITLFSTEGLCASVRRAASLLCPASPRQLVDVVLDAVAPLSADVTREMVADVLDMLVMSGDLLELRQSDGRARLLFLGPPTFVERQPGEYLLLGIRPRNVPLLDGETDLEVIYDGHMRTVLVDPALRDSPLVAAGLHRLSKAQWTKAPRTETSAQVVAEIQDLLDADESAPGAISGLSIIDPTKSVLFYRGRWRAPANADSGIYVGRRPQAYGAPLWCVVEMASGVPRGVHDLSVDSQVAPGWDEARRFQAALDAEHGAPQLYRSRIDAQTGGAMLDFFGPLPSWAERYLAISGRPAPRGEKALFSYCMPSAVVADVEQFLAASLWMTRLKEDH